MISPERAAEILRLYHAEKWKPGTLARQLGVHHATVRRVLVAAGQAPGLSSARPSIADPFVELIRTTLEKYPTLRASRLYAMAREGGYTGGPDHFRHVVARYRPAPAAEAYLRLRTLPGEEAQVDWGHFGKLRVGRVERAIRYVRDSFFAARSFTDLNAQAALWCEEIAAEPPCPEDRTRRVREVFAEERGRLLALPDNPFACQEREEVQVGRTPYARFDRNDYSVPHTYVRRLLVVQATLECVRVVDGTEVVATHPRSWEKGEQVEIAKHVAELLAFKRAARHHRGLDRLHHACASSDAFFAALAARHGNLGAATTALTKLLDLYGAAALDDALATALRAESPHLPAVRQILEQRRHAQSQMPPIAVALPDNAHVRDIVVHPHPLATYDQIDAGEDDDNSNR